MSEKKLLSICSSRSNPNRLKNMLTSWKATKTFGDMVVYIWKEDPKIELYNEVINKFPEVEFILGEKLFMTEVLNLISKERDYDYYQNINDDHFYIKVGWDKLMIEPLENKNGIGISYTKGKNNKNNPNAEVISKKIVKGLGYYIYPKFRQFGIEPYIISLGEKFGFHLVEEVIEHRSINAGFGERDETYDFIYGSEEQKNYNEAIREWKEVIDEECKRIVV